MQSKGTKHTVTTTAHSTLLQEIKLRDGGKQCTCAYRVNVHV